MLFLLIRIIFIPDAFFIKNIFCLNKKTSKNVKDLFTFRK